MATALFTLIWALPLAAGPDALVGWIGDHLSQSLYRFDTITPVVLADDSRKIDLLIVGGAGLPSISIPRFWVAGWAASMCSMPAKWWKAWEM